MTRVTGEPAVAEPRSSQGVASASFSRDGRYRYSLRRSWDAGPHVVWVMLNPSRATAEEDDPTLRRCAGFSRRWGFGSLEVVNLFAAVATEPADLRRFEDPVGPANDRALRAALVGADLVVAAWGAGHGGLLGRAARVRRRLDGAWCLGVTASGDPRHPLRLPAGLPLVPLPAV
ncbi:MAG: DUF1643 domain-containing protein [Dehalococcoidia bacterium]